MQLISVTTALSPFIDWSKVPPKRLEYAAQRGTNLHMCFSAYAQNLLIPALPADHQGYFDSFRRWFDKYVQSVLWVEKELIDEKYGYIGHPDILCILVSNEIVIVDYKTPVTESPTWKAQIAAYCRLANIDKGMVLQPHPDGWEARAIRYQNTAADFAAFLNALFAYRYFVK